jgi:hypothetical protein
MVLKVKRSSYMVGLPLAGGVIATAGPYTDRTSM